jgi:hypothetical protein
MNILRVLSLGIILVLISPVSNAIPINSISSGATSHEFVSSGFTAGPISESGITYTSSYSYSVYGYEGGYGFGGNGYWYGMDMIGLNTSYGAMTIEFDTVVSEVLAFVNYIDVWNGSAMMAIYDSSFNLLEDSLLNFSTGGAYNAGFDMGFKRNTNEIKYVQFIDQGIGATNLRSYTTSTQPVPEPSILALLGLGLFGLTVTNRRKIQS